MSHLARRKRHHVPVAAGAMALMAAGLLVFGGTALAAVGDVTEYPTLTPSSGPQSIAAGPDGNLWFTDFSSGKLAKVTTSGVVTEYPIPTANGGPNGIVAGPDGNMWFTEFNTVGNRVAKVTTSGVVTEYPVPSAQSSPFGIAVGPDGNLWFTEVDQGANSVAKVTTTGVITEYHVPTPRSGPVNIVAGPDGNLWFIEQLANQVAKVTTSGTFTEYIVPTAGSSPFAIAAGPDGNLWFTEAQGNKVARVTTSGVITEYPIPTAGSAPVGIAAGLDGNLWFTEFNGNQVGKVTTAGVITEYPIPTAGGSPNGITAGPDGNLWFTEYFASNVAKVVGGPPASAPPAIATQPLDQKVTAGSPATFNAWALGGPTPTVRWQVSPNGITFTDIAGATSTTLTIPITTVAMSGNRYHAVFTNSLGSATTSAATLTVIPPSAYTAVTPVRLMDTRKSGGPLGSGAVRNLTVAGVTPGAPAGATAVVLNVTVTNTSAASYLTVYPAGASQPLASNLNWVAGNTVPNLVTVQVASGGAITIFNGVGNADVVVDLEGYFAAPSGTAGGEVGLTPARITDTRPASGFPNAGGTLHAGSTLNVQVTSAGGVPAGVVSAAILNVTVTNTSAASFLTIWPASAPQPVASNLNWTAGVTVPNRVIVPVSASGMVSVFNQFGSADVIVDVSGYFTNASASGKLFTPVSPVRRLDTRASAQTLGPGGAGDLQISGVSGVPGGATAVVLNVTATNTTAPGFLTVFPSTALQPTASDLNWVAGATIPNLVVATLGTTGLVTMYNSAGFTDVIVDIAGWFS